MTKSETKALKALFFVLPISFIFIGLPLALGTVEPNSVYGVRTQATLASTETWYEVNSKFGRAACLAGLLNILFNLAFHTSVKMHAVVKLILSVVFAIFAIAIAIIYSLVFA